MGFLDSRSLLLVSDISLHAQCVSEPPVFCGQRAFPSASGHIVKSKATVDNSVVKHKPCLWSVCQEEE